MPDDVKPQAIPAGVEKLEAVLLSPHLQAVEIVSDLEKAKRTVYAHHAEQRKAKT